MLLTSGQVSMAISSTIVFIFTSLLFLSGYVLQQKTVHSLQAAIKPRLPKPLPASTPIAPPNLNIKWARPVGSRPGSDTEFQQHLVEETIDWNKLGYAQLVKDHVEVCSAIMMFGDLHRLRSPAKKILLFPRSWLQDNDEQGGDAYLGTSKRLLRSAARRFGVILMPMETIIDGADETLPSSYSLASLFSLVEYERIIYMSAPGILLDASPLDSLLAFSKSEPIAAFPSNEERKDISTSLLLIHPSMENYRRLKDLRSREPMTDLDLFRKSFSAPESLLSTWSLSMGNLFYESTSLRNSIDDFNSTIFIDATAYVRLSDPELPGPEYDVPFYDKAQIRPKNEEARMVWEKLYETFRQRRMEICGLDLEIWSRPLLQAENGDDEADEDSKSVLDL
ncbi:glycosyltransferase family 8 protein [Lepidopterella palustris CBS 459.81]|uniref:Glycosyltransferase family 8 protein n=1 Tax=Lepidopterella palustris CBS 459.81 TaxID=1314670 RepID=A0A8E2JI98_9PEZI|nr:glycosyltransferase family 8 protein [Lepidopterella palustris CBS 459.81]